MSRMITRNGGVRPADGSSAVTQDKAKESTLVADASAASSVKRTTDLFTEADKEALQPGGTAQGIKDAARHLLATATSDRAVLPQKEGSVASKPATGAGEAGQHQDKAEGVTAVATADKDDEDDGYLSDDPEERYEAAAKGEVAQRVRFAITLLVPVEFKMEVTRVQATLRALFGIWKKDLGVDVQTTTKFQELDVKPHQSGRLLHVRVRWGTRLVRLVALYFPGQAPPRGVFLGSAFKEVAASLPRGEDLLVAGDFNMIEDPSLDKSNRQGVTGDNNRMKQMLSDFHVKDVFREFYPDERQFTFYCRSAKVSSRIDRVLASQSLMHLVARVSHQWLPMGLTDHKYAVRKPGVKAAIDDVVRKQGEGGCTDFDKLSRCLNARLRKYDKEERKRVRQTRRALESQVDTLQRRVMADPGDDASQALLTTREAMLKRKAKTGIKELVRDGVSYSDAKAVLGKATRHFKMAFDVGSVGGDEARLLRWTPRRVLEDASAEELTRDWTEKEVRQAIRELANDKSPRKDGLPKELYQVHWESLKGPVMKMVTGLMETGDLPEVVNEAVTVLLYKKGDETDYGFLPRKRLTDAVSLVADLIDATKNKNRDWYLLLIDFEKAYDSVRRDFMLETIAKMGLPPRFVGWIEALHKDGCPLAPYLFLCAVEPLSRLVEERRLGIGEEGCERLAYIGYADDTTLLLDGEHQLKEVEQVLKEFAEASGLKVNKGKSSLLPLGCNVDKCAPDGTEFKWVKKDEAERLLGVWITPGGNGEITWEKAFDKAAGELRKWHSKYLTTGARVTIINSYVLPVFIFQAQVYPPEDLLWKRVETLIENFVSGNHADTGRHFRLWSGDLIYAPRE
ncbi:unnamed protein product [Closterium sp. Yama58-4]|nr:unnamed protein product [Closterium sp. Yama58-4]